MFASDQWTASTDVQIILMLSTNKQHKLNLKLMSVKEREAKDPKPPMGDEL